MGILNLLFPRQRKLEDAKELWRNKRNPCENAHIIFNAIDEEYRNSMHNIIEFGCSWGGNLKYFLERLPKLRAVGVDINKIVIELSKEWPNYKGIVGDENSLENFSDKEFDLAFTSSVLDHIPDGKTVKRAIGNLLRISKCVLLLEPFIEGVYGDVSGKTRDQVKQGLENGHKVFAPHSYFWNYDQILNEAGVKWYKTPMPLHAASLGPFYFLYFIQFEH